jgi:hypothetical protein
MNNTPVITEKPWRKSNKLPIRVKDIYIKYPEFGWMYSDGIILTELEISTLQYSTIKKLIKAKRENAMRSINLICREDVELCATGEVSSE